MCTCVCMSVCRRLKRDRCFLAGVDPSTVFVEPGWLFHRKTHTQRAQSVPNTHAALFGLRKPRHLPPPASLLSSPSASFSFSPSLPNETHVEPLTLRHHYNITERFPCPAITCCCCLAFFKRQIVSFPKL